MSLQDPIADMCTRIRNAHLRFKSSVRVPYSKQKEAIASVLQQEGYITSFAVERDDAAKRELVINLKYFDGKAVISKIERVSKPSLRIYKRAVDLPKVMGGLGVALVSTSKGLMSDRKAREINQGGEVICFVA